MNKTIERIDRLIANLRDDQQELMEMYDTLEMEINQLEKQADKLEAQSNELQYVTVLFWQTGE